MRSARPMRFKPAAAMTKASTSPSSSFLQPGIDIAADRHHLTNLSLMQQLRAPAQAARADSCARRKIR